MYVYLYRYIYIHLGLAAPHTPHAMRLAGDGVHARAGLGELPVALKTAAGVRSDSRPTLEARQAPPPAHPDPGKCSAAARTRSLATRQTRLGKDGSARVA